MQKHATSRRIGSRRLPLVLVLFVATAPSAGAASPDETTKLDCGVNSLFVLLQLQGRSVSLDSLLRALPRRHDDGYSMAELAAASKSVGLPLEGVVFAKGDRALDRPAIAFLNDAKGGHFAVLRPVGTTGTMVQTIDPPSAPWIGDYDQVLAAKPWTGRILIPRRPWLTRHAWLVIAISVCGLMLFTVALLRRSRLTKTGQTGVSVSV